MITTEKCRRSLANFVPAAWPILEPSNPFLPNWHIDIISEYLQAVSQGQIRRLIINMPPRYMKSLSVSVLWPVWSWINRPTLRWLFASYSSGLSTKHSLDRRQVIQSPWYQEQWGHIYQLAGDQNIKTEYMNTSRGHMLATSVGGTATGKGGDIIVVDDPHNPMQAESDALREAAVEFFDRTLTTRLDNKKTGAIVVVMQRLHELDLTGHLLKQNQQGIVEHQKREQHEQMCLPGVGAFVADSTLQQLQAPQQIPTPGEDNLKTAEEHQTTDNQGQVWTHLCLPVEAKRETKIVFPITGKEIIRQEGDLLWPARENLKDLAQVKIALGSYGYSGQYQQDPAPEGGGILQNKWWRYYSILPSVKDIEQGVISVDCAFKDLADSDYACIQAWWKIGANRYLIDQIRGKWSFPLLLTNLRAFIRKHDECRARLIEDKANGSAVIQTIRDEITGVIPVDPKGGKIARAHAVSPQLEAGNFLLPDPRLNPWVDDFTLECAKFPKSPNDDQVDCFTQAAMYMDIRQFSTWMARINWL